MAVLPELEPRHYTYVGFAFSFLGMVLALATILAVNNVLLSGWPWFPISVAAIIALGIATLSFHRMGTKRIAL
ncbi:MAG: hypothetical protein PHF51_01540 [Candidatus ainarchaeum sp.]|nr:hypothetical protein [Candidatus ainarchaeum sp.]